MDLDTIWDSVLWHFLTHLSNDLQGLAGRDALHADLSPSFGFLFETLGQITQYLRLLPSQRHFQTFEKSVQRQLVNPISPAFSYHSGTATREDRRLLFVTPPLSEDFLLANIQRCHKDAALYTQAYLCPSTVPIQGQLDAVRAFRICATLIAIQGFRFSKMILAHRAGQPPSLCDWTFDNSIDLVKWICRALKNSESRIADVYLKQCRIGIAEDYMIVFVPKDAKIGDQVWF